MKHSIITLLLLAVTLTATAQERVFQTVYKMASKTANDPKEDPGVRRIAMFRVDAVTYLNTQTLSLLTDSARAVSGQEAAHLSQQLDSMAYYMYDYVDLYLKEYQRARTDKSKQRVIKLFRDISKTFPLFGDPDRELVWVYCNSEDSLTPFSLDTDWVKACITVRQWLKDNRP